MKTAPAAIGKYRIERELGRGASGTVFLGHDRFHGRPVAIKQIHPALMADPALAARYRRQLQREAALIGRLSHPHIVTLFDVHEEADPPFLVLEYVPGESLAAFTAPDRLLAPARVLDIGFKCCGALEHAQRQGLVHRDLKPANILLRDDGEIKLADFGTALLLAGDRTQASGLVGSPAYMSPEQVREEPLTHRADMFSFGVVLYELLTGRRPFEADSDYATIYRICHEAPATLTLLRPDLPQPLDALVQRALAKDPLARFGDWSELAQALLDIQQRLPAPQAADSDSARFELLRAQPFFSGFHDVALWETLRLGQWQVHPAGATLTREGEAGDAFFLLLRGRVGVSRSGRLLNTQEAGVSIGEMSYLRSDQPLRSATVVAQTEVTVLAIRHQALRSASVELQERFDKAFIRLLVGRLSATSQQLADWDAAPAGPRSGDPRPPAG